jgi:KaiC/GvpD/RAD55 family RecA-like ATPase
MSQGLSLLRALIDAGARTEFRQVHERLFLETERPAYQFVSRFYRMHGQLPSVEACAENGFILPGVNNPVSYYLDRVRQRAQFNVVSDGQVALSNAMQARDMAAVISLIQQQARDLGMLETEQDTQSLAELAREITDDYEHAHAHPGMQGITLGWPVLDELTGGIEPGDVVTFAARPGMGKSWLLSHIAANAWASGSSVLFVSMEMTRKQIARRIIGMRAGINPNYIRRGQLSDWGRDALYQQLTDIPTGAPFHILSGSFNKSVPVVDAAIQEFSPDLVLIDASYLMDPSTKGMRKQFELLTDVAKEIKQMAMAREKGIIQSVQFNREAAKAKTRGTQHIGGTDAVGQITTIGIDIQPGTNPRTTRKLTLFKNREGEDATFFEINFLFSPPMFSHIMRPEDVVNIAVEDDEAATELGGL